EEWVPGGAAGVMGRTAPLEGGNRLTSPHPRPLSHKGRGEEDSPSPLVGEGRSEGERGPDAPSVPIAVVGLGARFGPFRGLRAFQERALGGSGSGQASAPESAPPANDWGVLGSSWAGREGLGPGVPRGYHLEELAVRPDRFRIPPKELEEMLPQQTLALLAA